MPSGLPSGRARRTYKCDRLGNAKRTKQAKRISPCRAVCRQAERGGHTNAIGLATPSERSKRSELVHAERFAVRQSEADISMRKGCVATERSEASGYRHLHHRRETQLFCVSLLFLAVLETTVHAERFAVRQSEADIQMR